MAEPQGKALDDLRRQREEQRQQQESEKAYEKARTYPETPVIKKAKGGYVRAADGCVQRGKTKGKMV